MLSRDAAAHKLRQKNLLDREIVQANYKKLKATVKSRLRKRAREYGASLMMETDTKDAWKFLREVTFTKTKGEKTTMDLSILNDHLAKTVQSKEPRNLVIPASCDDLGNFRMPTLSSSEVLTEPTPKNPF